MNRLVIIGNGFDMAHGLKTSYMDFINWYLEQRLNALLTERSPISEDCLCRLEIRINSNYTNWYLFFYSNYSFRNTITGKWNRPPSAIIRGFKDNTNTFSVTYSPFFERIMKSFETKRWVDIENDYYEILKNCIKDSNYNNKVKELNQELDFLRNELVKYLATIKCEESIPDIWEKIKDDLYFGDVSTEGKRQIRNDQKNLEDKLFPPEHLPIDYTMLLSFNYTETAEMYKGDNIGTNYIHGKLDHPEHIIFGYGDELDKDYPNLRDKNDNELLKNVKSVKYLETSNYRRMLDFIDSAPFQVLIMGHSCGNSDRTLLNTVFEHENCISIKPYYHQWEDGNDNYLEIVQNISRNFTDPKLFRDRVVNKEQCQTM